MQMCVRGSARFQVAWRAAKTLPPFDREKKNEEKCFFFQVHCAQRDEASNATLTSEKKRRQTIKGSVCLEEIKGVDGRDKVELSAEGRVDSCRDAEGGGEALRNRSFNPKKAGGANTRRGSVKR